MRLSALFLSVVIVLFASSCGSKSNEHDHEHDATAADEVEVSANQELYNEVMKVHDEVMPKMDDIRKLKNDIKERLEKSSTLSKTERLRLDAMLAKLDSAGDGMMIWMREFRPLPDSLGEENARKYLEGEMERVRKVRDRINAALEEASKGN